MKKAAFVSIAMLALSAVAQSQQPGGVVPGPAGHVGYIFLPTPTVPESLADSRNHIRPAFGSQDPDGHRHERQVTALVDSPRHVGKRLYSPRRRTRRPS